MVEQETLNLKVVGSIPTRPIGGHSGNESGNDHPPEVSNQADFRRGDKHDPDSILHNCEDGSFTYTGFFRRGDFLHNPLYVGEYPEYDRSVDIEKLNLGTLLGLYRLGEPGNDTTAWEARDTPAPSTGKWTRSGLYEGEGTSENDRFQVAGNIPDSGDAAHSFDGYNDKLTLQNSTGYNTALSVDRYDPANYLTDSKSDGFSVEMWAKFPNAAGAVEYLYYKDATVGSKIYGLRIYRFAYGHPYIAAVIDRGDDGSLSMVADTNELSNPTGWHHYAVVLSKTFNSAQMYIDSQLVKLIPPQSTSILPTVKTGTAATIGYGPSGGGYGRFDMDNLAIYKSALKPCQVMDHFQISVAGSYPDNCG